MSLLKPEAHVLGFFNENLAQSKVLCLLFSGEPVGGVGRGAARFGTGRVGRGRSVASGGVGHFMIEDYVVG